MHLLEITKNYTSAVRLRLTLYNFGRHICDVIQNFYVGSFYFQLVYA